MAAISTSGSGDSGVDGAQAPVDEPDDVAIPEGGGIAAVLARAEAAVADLAREYSTWALADVARACQALTQAETDAAGRPAHVETLFRVAHDLKGQGSSFGYPLITKVGGSLCRLTRDRARQYGRPDLELAKSHLDAIELVLTKQIKGEGGKVGADLIAKLEQRVTELIG